MSIKIRFGAIFILTAAILLWPVTSNVTYMSDSGVVVIPDESLKEALLFTLEKDQTEEITEADMAGLDELTVRHAGVKDLTGLEYATNLTYLDLCSNPINNFDALSGLTGLERLLLCSNYGNTKMPPLSNLVNLKYLRLNNNDLADLNALPEALNLEVFHASNNRINDISQMSKLTGLKHTNFHANNISDISSLEGLDNLEILSLTQNNIEDVAPLSGLTNLQELYLGRNYLEDISSLSALSNLEKLRIFGNKISDISSLKDLTGLQQLSVSNNRLTSAPVLTNLVNLERLNLSENWLTDITELEHLTWLNSLWVDENYLDMSEDSGALNVVNTLKENNVSVYYEEQYWGEGPGTITGTVTDSETGEPVSSVSIDVEGYNEEFDKEFSGRVTTDLEGRYWLDIPEASYEISAGRDWGHQPLEGGTCYANVELSETYVLDFDVMPKDEVMLGGVAKTGEINVQDAIIVLRGVVGLHTFTPLDNYLADVNGDGKIDVSDAILILRYIVGLIPDFSVHKGNVDLMYVGWECAVASTYVASTVLQDMGYNVNETSVNAHLMWNGLATGAGDAFTTAWLPHTHAGYYEDTKGQVEELAVNYADPAKLGLVVPSYVDIDSIEEINDYAGQFNNSIAGIDPGSGINYLTEEAIDEYGLDTELVEGTYQTMIADLKDASDREEWIIVTGWSPHWKFAEWDLKFLEDPKGVFGEEEYIATFVRLGLAEDMPEVYNFLKNFQWGIEDIGAVMNMNAKGMDPTDSAREWVDENQDKVQSWIP